MEIIPLIVIIKMCKTVETCQQAQSVYTASIYGNHIMSYLKVLQECFLKQATKGSGKCLPKFSLATATHCVL